MFQAFLPNFMLRPNLASTVLRGSRNLQPPETLISHLKSTINGHNSCQQVLTLHNKNSDELLKSHCAPDVSLKPTRNTSSILSHTKRCYCSPHLLTKDAEPLGGSVTWRSFIATKQQGQDFCLRSLVLGSSYVTDMAEESIIVGSW